MRSQPIGECQDIIRDHVVPVMQSHEHRPLDVMTAFLMAGVGISISEQISLNHLLDHVCKLHAVYNLVNDE